MAALCRIDGDSAPRESEWPSSQARSDPSPAEREEMDYVGRRRIGLVAVVSTSSTVGRS